MQVGNRVHIKLEHKAELAEKSIISTLCPVLHGEGESALRVRSAHNKIRYQGWSAIRIRDLFDSHPDH